MMDGIRKLLSVQQATEYDRVKCYYCQHWGYNNHRSMNEEGKSKCLLKKKKTFSTTYCDNFLKLNCPACKHDAFFYFTGVGLTDFVGQSAIYCPICGRKLRER